MKIYKIVFTRFFLSAMFFFAGLAQADLSLDAKLSAKQAAVIVEPLREKIIRPYGDLHSAKEKKELGLGTFTRTPWDSNFLWDFNNQKYISNIAGFVPDARPTSDCRNDSSAPDCDWIRMRHVVCHLFLFDDKLELAAVAAMPIKRDPSKLQGFPFCLEVKAMAVAKVIEDAMLVTVGYIDSASPADSRNEAPTFYMTKLLRFSDKSGKLVVTQDDTCLGNPNKYDTIAKARAALTKCGVRVDVQSGNLKNDDLQECNVLLGKSKINAFQLLLNNLRQRADAGDEKAIKTYVEILSNRFNCYEELIADDDTREWSTSSEVKGGIRETQYVAAVDISKNPAAITALYSYITASKKAGVEIEPIYGFVAAKEMLKYIKYFPDSYLNIYRLSAQSRTYYCNYPRPKYSNQNWEFLCKDAKSLTAYVSSKLSQSVRDAEDAQAVRWADGLIRKRL